MLICSLLSSFPGNLPLTRASERFPPEGKWTTAQPSRTKEKDGGKRSCKCKAVIESVLVPLARHYVATGNASRAFYYLLECAAAYLHVSNSYMALMKLSEAEVLRNSMGKTATVLDCFEKATFFSLKAEVIIIPRILYHPEDCMYTQHTVARHHLERRERFTALTLATLIILGGAGVGTRVASLVKQNQEFTSLRIAVDEDLTQIEQFISALENLSGRFQR
eukprot:XP_027304272.1 adenylate cyclase type 10-like [Anas platyrhynchos]